MLGVVHATEQVVVDDGAGDAAVDGEHAGLRPDLLGGEDATHGAQQRVAVEQLEVAGELLDAVDVATPLDLDGDRGAGGVAAHQVDRADGGGVLAPDEGQAVGQGGRVLREEFLQMLLYAVLLEPGVDAEVVGGVVEDLLDQDAQRVVRLRRHRPLDPAVLGGRLPDRARRAHPVERLVGAAVGVHQHRAVGLEHEHACRHRQVRRQPSGVVHLAARDDQSHGEESTVLPMYDVRPARDGDLPGLSAIEDSGVAMFEDVLGDLSGDVLASKAPSGEERASRPGFLLVAGDPAVGFVHVLDLDGHAHLEQISVLPSVGRQGIGTALVRAAVAEAADRGFDAVTLCTYADLPWNGPYYARLGFTEVEPIGHLERLRAHEQEIGLDRHGRRVAMRIAVPTT